MSNREQLEGRKISLFEVKVGAFPQMAALVFPTRQPMIQRL